MGTHNFMKQSIPLFDEIIVTIAPILLGEGMPLLNQISHP